MILRLEKLRRLLGFQAQDISLNLIELTNAKEICGIFFWGDMWSQVGREDLPEKVEKVGLPGQLDNFAGFKFEETFLKIFSIR